MGKNFNLRVTVATGILVVWAIIFLRSAFDPNFAAPPEISTVALAAASYLFLVDARKKP